MKRTLKHITTTKNFKKLTKRSLVNSYLHAFLHGKYYSFFKLKVIFISDFVQYYRGNVTS